MSRVLIVDDDGSQRRIMCSILSEQGHEVEEAPGVDRALELIESRGFDVVLTDMKMPGKSGLDLVESLSSLENPPEIVVITAFGTIDTAVRAMREGAYDYMTKPIEHDELILVVERAAEKRSLRVSSKEFQGEQKRRARESIIVESAAMKSILETAAKVATSDSTVLLRGESGTGKERIARYIHSLSPRSVLPIQCINCAAFPEALLESELFGYEKGAFTGANMRKPGILEAANGSTVFLDEVADMSLPLQAKLLRVLQEKEIRRLGATTATYIDVRFIAATNKSLEESVKSGTFRDDLFYRLNVIPITIPPLRERAEDIPALVERFLSRRGKPKEMSPDAMARLATYGWPGNVRELEAVIERVAILSSGQIITVEDLPPEIQSGVGSAPSPTLPASGIVFEDWEKSMLEQALKQAGGTMTEAARLLGMTYRTFQYRAEKFGLGKEQ